MQTAVAVTAPPQAKFDRERARRIWDQALFWENRGPHPYCTFTFENHANGTKLIVGIHDGRQLSVDLDVMTLDCPPLGTGQHRPYQCLCRIGLHGFERVEYQPENGWIDFFFQRPRGENTRQLRVFKTGYFWLNSW